MDIDGRLDLHGNTQQEARRDLMSFIDRSYTRGDRCVLVITGKGLHLYQPALIKTHVPIPGDRWTLFSTADPSVCSSITVAF